MTPKAPILMVVTDPSIPDLMDRLADAIVGGVRLVQYRDKAAATAQRTKWLKTFKTRFADALVIVNDDVDALREADADGLHMSATFSLGQLAARELGPGRLMGRSIHTEGLDSAVSGGCRLDYVLFGSVFPSASHPGGPTAGVEGLRVASQRIQSLIGDIPVLAVGGIDATNAADCIRAGAQGVAVVRSVLLARDPAKAAAETLRAMREAI